MKNNKKNPISRLYTNLSQERNLFVFASFSSVVNKILDLAPPVIIGLAVDIVRFEIKKREQDSQPESTSPNKRVQRLIDIRK